MSLKYQTYKISFNKFHSIKHTKHGELHKTGHYAAIKLNDKHPWTIIPLT